MGCYDDKKLSQFREMLMRFTGAHYRRAILYPDYEGAVQDALIELHKDHERHHNRPLKNPEAWLRKVVSRKIWKLLQDLTRHQVTSIDGVFQDNLPNQSPDQLTAAMVNDLLDRFKPEEQDLIMKVYAERKSRADIAKDYGISRTSAHNLVVDVSARLDNIVNEGKNGL